MALPSSFSGNPGGELHHYFRNVCISLKKVITSTKNVTDLQNEMDRFINASKQMRWHHTSEEVWRKDEGDKAALKVLNEFQRYIKALAINPKEANPQDLIEAVSNVERLIHNLKIN